MNSFTFNNKDGLERFANIQRESICREAILNSPANKLAYKVQHVVGTRTRWTPHFVDKEQRVLSTHPEFAFTY